MVSEAELQSVTDEDHARITKAIRAVEKTTSGEVFAVVARQSDDYFFVAGFMAALWALLIGLAIALASLFVDIDITVATLASAQIASFLASLLVFRIFPAVRLWFVPRSIAYRRASNNAVRQFLAQGIHTTSDRSGVLIFVSLAEHYAEIIADSGINEKVDQTQWDAMVATLTEHARRGRVADGFIAVIENAGALLSQHFPPVKGEKNELNDRLVEL